MTTPETIKAVRDVIAAAVAFASIFPIYKTLAEVKLKAKTEKLNAEKVNVEMDIQLSKHFAELMEIANGRGKSELSNMVIDKLFSEKLLTKTDLSNIKELKNQLNELAIFVMPIGAASQNAAIAAIGALASKHIILRIPGIEALESLASFSPVAKTYLDRLSAKDPTINSES